MPTAGRSGGGALRVDGAVRSGGNPSAVGGQRGREAGGGVAQVDRRGFPRGCVLLSGSPSPPSRYSLPYGAARGRSGPG